MKNFLRGLFRKQEAEEELVEIEYPVICPLCKQQVGEAPLIVALNSGLAIGDPVIMSKIRTRHIGSCPSLATIREGLRAGGMLSDPKKESLH